MASVLPARVTLNPYCTLHTTHYTLHTMHQTMNTHVSAEIASVLP